VLCDAVVLFSIQTVLSKLHAVYKTTPSMASTEIAAQIAHPVLQHELTLDDDADWQGAMTQLLSKVNADKERYPKRWSQMTAIMLYNYQNIGNALVSQTLSVSAFIGSVMAILQDHGSVVLSPRVNRQFLRMLRANLVAGEYLLQYRAKIKFLDEQLARFV